MAENKYTAEDILVLSGPQGIRKRPGMYVGSTGSRGFIHLLYEVLDNAVDEALAGYCKNIKITLIKDGDVDVAEVSDDGRGIPVDVMHKEGKPALEVIMTSLHSGAKFDSKTYKVAGGLHGVGLTVVNSLSEYTEVTVKRNGKIYQQTFSKGEPSAGLKIIGDASPSDTGTTIKFKPDTTIFSVKSFDSMDLVERLRQIAFLNKGINIELIDSREVGAEHRETFVSQRGIPDFIEFIRGNRVPLTKPIIISKETDSTKVELGIQYVQGYSEEVLSFVNNIRTAEGGTHVIGLHSALTKAIVNYIQRNSKKNAKQKAQIEGEDTREGLIAVLSVMMQNPEFEGQTKEKLGNPNIKNIVETTVYSTLSTYLEENPSEASSMISKVVSAAEARESARRARELARKKSLFDGPLLPGKLADCTESDPEKSEIFIVEGESAAGSSKQGRDRQFQAILPLKGKILNVEKASDDKIFNNVELHSMVTAFGVGIRETFNPENLRYKKVILLTDADVDGSHIRTLLLTFFYRYMRPLIERGNIFIAQPPLYRITKGKESRYIYSDSLLSEELKNDPKVAIQRYKGLGEMNPEQLWDTTMNPANRVLKRVSIKDAQFAEAIFSVLMGMDVEKRRHFLEEHSTEVSFLDI
jgi:DNA gyrase subunit B